MFWNVFKFNEYFNQKFHIGNSSMFEFHMIFLFFWTASMNSIFIKQTHILIKKNSWRVQYRNLSLTISIISKNF